MANEFAQPVGLASSHRKIDWSDTVGVHPITTLHVFGELLDGLNTMTRILRRWTTRKMAMAKEKRSFESALASILEELDLSFSLKHKAESFPSLCLLLWFTPPVDCFRRSGYVILLWLVVALTYCVQRQCWKTILLPPLGSAEVYRSMPDYTF